MVLLLIWAASSLAQIAVGPKFRAEIQANDEASPQFSVTNLSGRTLTACTIEFSVSTEARSQGRMNWDPLVQGGRGPRGEAQGPLEPGQTLTLFMPHKVGGPLPDKVEVIAGIWADGETFGEAVWVKTLVDYRASLVSAYEQAIALLKEGIEGNWTRQQYLAAMDGKPQSLPVYSMRTTFQANQALDQHPEHAKNVAQSLLNHFQQALQMLRPQNAAEPSAPGQLFSTPGAAVAKQSNPQSTNDVVIRGATLNDGFMGPMTCNAEGQVYRRPAGRGQSVMRVDKDGSTQLFTLPESELTVGVIAPAGMGLAVLNDHYSQSAGVTFEMYRFDGQGKLIARHNLSLDFRPVIMAVSSSGNVTLVGYRPVNGRDEAARKFTGAILSADDEMAHLFDIPPTASGDPWIPVHSARMEAADGVAHLILQTGQSGKDPNFGLASIRETGDVQVIPLETTSGARAHDWFFGGSVAAELYQFSGEKPPPVTHWDTYDLSTGERIATKTLLPAGFAVACYLGDEVSMLAASAHVEKSRGLSPDALRLVNIKLQ